MQDIPTEILALFLVVLIITSAGFSASETAMMAINRYRLKHKAQSGHRPSILIDELLQAPDRLLGTILIGNNIANIGATTLTTVIGLKLYGDLGIAIATALLVLVILVFAEIAPKTLAATRPELIAYPAAYVLKFLQTIFNPVIWLVNTFSNGFLKIFGVSPEPSGGSLTPEELRAAVLQGLQAGQSVDELAGSIMMDKYKDWLSYDQWRELNVRGMARHLLESGAVEQ